MTAPTGLGQYTKPQGSQGDRIQAQQMVDRPLLVWVRKVQHLNRTKFSATGGDAVYIDFVDLLSNQVYIEVMWMAGAIVDGLKQYAGDGNAYPVKVVKVQGGQWGSYQTIESLSEDPQWMNHIQANLPAFQNLIAQTRAQKEQEWAIAMQQSQQPPAPPQVSPAAALAPVGAAAPQYQQPAQYGGVPQQMQPAPGAGQFGPPAGGATPPPPAASQQYQQPAAAQVPAGPPPPQYQQAPPAQPQQQAPAAPPAQLGYQPQQYQVSGAPPQQQQQQYQQQPAAAVAPPQYQQAPAAPPGPPAAPPQQFQQAGPPAAPVQQYPPQGLPPAPGAVTGQTVEQLTAALNSIG